MLLRVVLPAVAAKDTGARRKVALGLESSFEIRCLASLRYLYKLSNDLYEEIQGGFHGGL